jgi:hypothetical protein
VCLQQAHKNIQAQVRLSQAQMLDACLLSARILLLLLLLLQALHPHPLQCTKLSTRIDMISRCACQPICICSARYAFSVCLLTHRKPTCIYCITAATTSQHPLLAAATNR